jgi:hypothetical protein
MKTIKITANSFKWDENGISGDYEIEFGDKLEDPSLECYHTNITSVKENYVDNRGYYMHPKTYIKCADCDKILNIHTITHQEITKVISE